MKRFRHIARKTQQRDGNRSTAVRKNRTRSENTECRAAPPRQPPPTGTPRQADPVSAVEPAAGESPMIPIPEPPAITIAGQEKTVQAPERRLSDFGRLNKSIAGISLQFDRFRHDLTILYGSSGPFRVPRFCSGGESDSRERPPAWCGSGQGHSDVTTIQSLSSRKSRNDRGLFDGPRSRS